MRNIFGEQEVQTEYAKRGDAVKTNLSNIVHSACVLVLLLTIIHVAWVQSSIRVEYMFEETVKMIFR